MLTSTLSLICQFGIFGVPILNSSTPMIEAHKVGQYSHVNFQGSPTKQVPNLPFAPQPGENLRFQFDEGLEANNILIVVFSEKVSETGYKAYAENPQSTMYKKMSGTCDLK